jgi:hypothetical protein
MSEPDYLKCHCQSCRNSIEFPAAGLGQTIPCPHCGQSTVLALDTSDAVETPSAPTPKPRRAIVAVALVAVILAGAAAGLFALRNRPDTDTATRDAGSGPATNSPAPSATPGAAEPTTPPIPGAPKSLADLKPGVISLEKAKGSSLVYAVGILRNDSGHQRFGVNIELELTDARGNKAGTAKDYRAVLEPRQEWRFRALVLDSKAVAAKVSSIREE